jgi:predicted aspartyl protease
LISRRSLLTQAAVLAAGAAGAWWIRDHVVWPTPQAAFVRGAVSSGWLSFEDGAPAMVLIDVRVNGRAVRALVDSGAQTSVVDRTLAEAMDLPVSPLAPVVAFGVSGAPQIGRSARLDLQLGELAFHDLRAAVLELAPIAAASGRRFALVLGQDILSQVVADIDFPNNRIAFEDPAAHVTPADALAIPARRLRRELLADVEIEGRPLEVVVDTGASGALALSPDSAEAVGLLDGRPVRSAPSITFGGVSRDRAVRARSLRFAGVVFEDVLVHVYTPPTGATRTPAGLLGVGVLGGFRVILDLPGGRLHLIPGLPPRRGRRRRGA